MKRVHWKILGVVATLCLFLAPQKAVATSWCCYNGGKDGNAQIFKQFNDNSSQINAGTATAACNSNYKDTKGALNDNWVGWEIKVGGTPCAKTPATVWCCSNTSGGKTIYSAFVGTQSAGTINQFCEGVLATAPGFDINGTTMGLLVPDAKSCGGGGSTSGSGSAPATGAATPATGAAASVGAYQYSADAGAVATGRNESNAASGWLPAPHGKCPTDYLKAGGGVNGSGPCDDGSARDYSLDDFKRLAVILANFLVGISGAVLLVLLVYGSFLWILSAGNSKMVEKGKGVLTSAAIGILIIFVSYTAVAYGLKLLLNNGSGNEHAQYLPGTAAPGSLTTPSGGAGGGAGATGSTKIGKIYKYTGDATMACGDAGFSCVDTDKCETGYLFTGSCSGGQQCCVPLKDSSGDSTCSRLGGSCLDSTKNACDGGVFVQNFCDKKGQGNNIVCCFK